MLKLAISMAKTSQGAFMSELMRFDNNFLKLPRIEHENCKQLSQRITLYYLCMHLQLVFRRKNIFSERMTSFQRFKQKHKKIRAELRLTGKKIYSNNCITTSLQGFLSATLKRHAGKNTTGHS